MPRAIQFDRTTSASPEAITARLKKETRWSLLAFQGSPLPLGDKPLKGVVKADGFTIGFNHRDMLQLLQPTARMKMARQPDGTTRVHGEVGIPSAMVWTLRLVTAVVCPLAITAAIIQLVSVNWMMALGIAVLMSLGLIFGVGVNISHAESQLDALVQKVEESISVPTPPTSTTNTAERDAHHAAQQARARLKL